MDDGQKNVALAYIGQLNRLKVFQEPIVTRVDPYKGFYPAEAYHQDFLIRNPQYPYIVYVDLPKLKNFQRVLPEYYQGQPVTVSGGAAH